MIAENGKRLYGKLRSQYGNSFQSLIQKYSLNLLDESALNTDDMDKPFVAKLELNNKSGNMQKISPEEVISCAAIAEMSYFSESSLMNGACNNSYESVKDQLELLANRVTKGIRKY